MSLMRTDDRLEVIHDCPDEISEDVGPGTALGSAGSDQSEVPDVVEVQPTERPTFTITDAAAACSVSRKTITRKLSDLADHGAAKDDDGVWRIPVEALLAVGLHPGRSVPEVTLAAPRPAPSAAPPRPVDAETVTISRDRWDDLRIRLARAEAEANERAAALADARLALRALTAGPSGSVDARAQPTPAPALVVPASEPHGPQPADTAPSVRTSSAPTGVEQVRAHQAPPAAPVPPAAAVPSAEPPHGVGPVPSGTEDLVAARNLAARTGGYVPASVAPAKKRRWWQSH